MTRHRGPLRVRAGLRMPGAGRGLLLSCGSGPAIPGGRWWALVPLRLLAAACARIADNSPLRLLCRVGLRISPPSQNGEVARLQVLGESVAQSGFEPGARLSASPGVLRGVQRRAANRALSWIAAASRALDSIL